MLAPFDPLTPRPFDRLRVACRFPVPLFLAVASSLLAPACEKVPLLAPSGSSITLTAAATALPLNGTTDIIAQVIEPAGTPPHTGTHVTFTTTLGTIQPLEVRTDLNGRVAVKFLSGARSGTATITAISGGATGTNGSNTVKIAIGTAAVGRVAVSASPATVPAIGGSTTITANVLDVNGNVLSSVPVTFSTTAGSLSAGVVTTDANGVATTTLTTSQAAIVTASVGAQAPAPAPPASGGTTGGSDGGTTGGSGSTSGTTSSGQASGSVVINISAAPTLVISPPSTPPSVGLPASFTFTVTVASQNGSAVRALTVTWGDGRTQALGAITGNAVVSHVYSLAGTYTISATVTDAAGNTSTVSTAVTVIPVPRPTIIITPSPRTVTVNGTITFSIQVTATAGIGVQSTRIDFGDGTSQELGGASSASVPHDYGPPAGTKTVTVTVLDTTGQTTIGTTSVTITP